MNNNKGQRIIYASTLGAILSVLFVTVITIWAELSPALKDWLKNLSGHHWKSKGYLMMALYAATLLIVYFAARNITLGKIRKAIWYLIAATLGGTAAIFFFFVWHYLVSE